MPGKRGCRGKRTKAWEMGLAVALGWLRLPHLLARGKPVELGVVLFTKVVPLDEDCVGQDEVAGAHRLGLGVVGDGEGLAAGRQTH